MEKYFCTTHGHKLLPGFICPECRSTKDNELFSQEYWVNRIKCDDDKWPSYDQFKNEKRRNETKKRRLCHNCKTFSYHSLKWCHSCGQERVYETSTNGEFLEKYPDYKGGA